MVSELPPDISQSSYDFAYLRKVLLCLSELSISTVIDVGANEGQFASLLRRSGYTGRIISFEPLTAARRLLEDLASSDAAWEVFPNALGSKNESLTLHQTASSVMSSFRFPTSIHLDALPTSKIVSQESVEVRCLDDLLPQLEIHDSSRVFLKVDTQGYDLEVLRGASQLISRVPLIQTELAFRNIYQEAPSFLSLIEFMESSNYRIVSLHPVVFHSQSGDLLQSDALWRLDCEQ